MFTGIVQAIGAVHQSQRRGKALRLFIDAGRWNYAPKARIGDSVCVAGVCLTLVHARRPSSRPTRRILEFDVVAETLDKTTLGSLPRGRKVNLEHAATASTLLGGHLVQGHVDGIGRISKVQRGEDWRVWIDLPNTLRLWMVSKGSVAIDGVSLTIAGLTRRGIWVALIPETLEKTTLADLDVGDTVNVEADVIAKMVAKAREFAVRKPKSPARSKTTRPRRP
jgi:riboflavin synthase